jgi:DNA-binding MarR family transcriptional regulator
MIDEMASDPSDVDFGILFALAFRCYVDHLHEQLAEQGFAPVRSSFGPVLRALRDRPASLTTLAGELGISKQAVARVVDDMRAAGLVEQTPDPADGRARVLSLTARGDAMVAAAIAIGTGYEAALADELGPRQARALRQGLEAIVRRAGAASELAARRVRSL